MMTIIILLLLLLSTLHSQPSGFNQRPTLLPKLQTRSMLGCWCPKNQINGQGRSHTIDQLEWGTSCRHIQRSVDAKLDKGEMCHPVLLLPGSQQRPQHLAKGTIHTFRLPVCLRMVSRTKQGSGTNQAPKAGPESRCEAGITVVY